ncbi:helix-turn-helix transcriptional regulator [uncultured Brevundimonas sp.]|uniref:helix-turn-helix transcriptional regulator n=1 Tax=uncultured Brevundimonas sp. TaxID=213418 RepID=UPI002632F9B6|nr:helix-turn-helix transcriptional regulator [uncultured Brevundimonas sp.]
MIDAELSISEQAGRMAVLGQEVGLPQVAAWADISSTRPVVDANGEPVPHLFDFAAHGRDYWKQPDLTLRMAIFAVVRQMSEPFFFDDGVVGSWRRMVLDEALVQQLAEFDTPLRRSIICPVHLPRNVIGAVVWATEEVMDVRAAFETYSERMQAEALRFIAMCDETRRGREPIGAIKLTRREIQCLKLAAGGKTDSEIGVILGLSTPTVRFHLKNAGEKLGRTGRLRIVQQAASLGFVSTR